MIKSITLPELLNIENFRDSEQRPLGEYKADEPFKKDVSFELKKCPYHDTRLKHDYPMNISALRQMMTYWDDSKAAFQYLRRRYSHYRGVSLDKIIDNFYFCHAIVNLPSWLLKRAKNPFLDGSLPPVIAVMYKITIGLHRVLQVFISGKMMVDDVENSLQVSATDLLTYSDLGGFLIGTQEVCAGPPKYIEQAIDTILFDIPSFSKPENTLDLFIENYEVYFTYSDSIARISSAENSLRILSFFTLNELVKNTPSSPDQKFDKEFVAIMAGFDNANNLQNYLNTRSELQLNKLILGWLKIALPPIFNNEIKFFNTHVFQKNTTDCKLQFEKYLEFEEIILKIFKVEERQFNKMLGYESSVKTKENLEYRLEITNHMIRLFESLNAK